jgi:hypothetical protein
MQFSIFIDFILILNLFIDVVTAKSNGDNINSISEIKKNITKWLQHAGDKMRYYSKKAR